MSEPIRKPKQTPESYNPKNKPEILNMMETVKSNKLQYPPQYRIKPKGKTAAYTGAGWPHSNAYPATFATVSLFYGKEPRLNDKGAYRHIGEVPDNRPGYIRAFTKSMWGGREMSEPLRKPKQTPVSNPTRMSLSNTYRRKSAYVARVSPEKLALKRLMNAADIGWIYMALDGWRPPVTRRLANAIFRLNHSLIRITI